MIDKYGNANGYKISPVTNHLSSIAKLNFGIVINMILIPAFFFSFLVALCRKFDGVIDTNIFILLIPLWTVILPLIIFLVVNGVATKNSRANKCEKLSLSLMVPSGIIASTILLLLHSEGYMPKAKIFVLLIPSFVSDICTYLYLRCLIKP